MTRILAAGQSSFCLAFDKLTFLIFNFCELNTVLTLLAPCQHMVYMHIS